MNAPASKPDENNNANKAIVVSNDDDANSYLKGMIEREHISYLHNKDLYETHRNSLPAAVPRKETKDATAADADVDASSTKSDSEQEADLTSFRALKNLDEDKIYRNSLRRHHDSFRCDHDTLWQLQMKPVDLTTMCTTSKSTKVLPTTARTVQEWFDIPKEKPNVVVDPAAQFYNNFFG
jgi:hypothetical protein